LANVADTPAPGPLHEGRKIAAKGLERRRLTINAIAGTANYVLLMAIGIWYTPFMLAHLPESVYGLIPLATSLTNYLSVIMTMISGSVSRYVTADLSRGDVAAANATFNSFVFGGLKLLGVLFVGVCVFCYYLPLRVPPGYERKASWLFLAILGSFLINSYGSCFETAIWASNRFEIRSMIEIAAMVVRNGCVVLLFLFTMPDLWQVAVAVPLAAVFQISMQYLAWKRLTPELRIDKAAQTPAKQKLIYSVGGWMLMAHIGNQLMLSSDLLLVNRYFGTIFNAKYGVIILWSTILRSLFSTLGFLILPSLVAYEATGELTTLVTLVTKSVRIMGMMISTAAGVLCGLALPILTAWLRKPWVDEIAPITWFILIPLMFEISVISLSTILIAPERVRRYSLTSMATGVSTVILSLLLLTYTDLGIYGIALSAGSMSILRNAILYSIQATSGLPVPWYHFLRLHTPQMVRFGGAASLAALAGFLIHPASRLSVILTVTGVAMILLVVNYLTLNREDRSVLDRFLEPVRARLPI
jgi:O-antigen/teichoic acid export membrane protein